MSDASTSWIMKMMAPTLTALLEPSEDTALGYPFVTSFQEEEDVATKIGGGHVIRKESMSRRIINTNDSVDDGVDETSFLDQHPFLRGGIHENNSANSTDHITTRISSKRPLQHDGFMQFQQPFKVIQTYPTNVTTTTTNLVSMGTKVETLLMVGAVVGLFGLAMLCLACSMSGRDVWQKCCGSRCGCCCCCCQKQRPSEGDDYTDDHTSSPPTCHYATIQEFVFNAEDDTAPALLVNVPTTMEQLFPDLLASSSDDLEVLLTRHGRRRRRRVPTNNGDVDEESNAHNNAHLGEPLL